MRAITGFVWLGALIAFGGLAFDTAYAQRGHSAGSMARPNALSTTVYGTQAPRISTNAGPIGGRPAFAISPNFPTAPLSRNGGTNSIGQTKALFGNTPYAGPQPPPGGNGAGVPGWNGTGNPTGRLRSPSFARRIPGPLLIPESLGNPEANGDIPTLNGPPLTGKRAAAYRAVMDDYVRSISAYPDADRGGQQNAPPANSQSGNRTTRGSRWPEWPKEKAFDVRSISAYGDLERAEEQKNTEQKKAEQKNTEQKNAEQKNAGQKNTGQKKSSNGQPPAANGSATNGTTQPSTTAQPPSNR